jgi:hypothetical protein
MVMVISTHFTSIFCHWSVTLEGVITCVDLNEQHTLIADGIGTKILYIRSYVLWFCLLVLPVSLPKKLLNVISRIKCTV